MKKISLLVIALLGLPASFLSAMDAPDGWKPRARVRPTAINYGTTPLTPAVAKPAAINPVPQAAPQNPTDTADDTQVAQSTNYHGFMMSNAQSARQPRLADPTNFTDTRTATSESISTINGNMTAKEQERLDKIEKDLDKIVEVLKEMGFDLLFTAISAAALDPIDAAFSASNSFITIPKLIYYFGNMEKHILFLSTSGTSPAAKEKLKELTPRLKVVSGVILKAAKAPKVLKELAQQIIFSLSKK